MSAHVWDQPIKKKNKELNSSEPNRVTVHARASSDSDRQSERHRCRLLRGNTAGECTSEQSRGSTGSGAWHTTLRWFTKTPKLILPVATRSMASLTDESEDRARCARSKHAHLLLEQSSRSSVQQRLLRRAAEHVKPEVAHPVVWIRIDAQIRKFLLFFP